MGIQLPQSYYQPPFQQSSSYTPFSGQPIEEESDIEWSRKVIFEYMESQNSIDSSIPQNSQIQDPYSFFQVPPRQEEPCDFENSTEYMIQDQNSFI